VNAVVNHTSSERGVADAAAAFTWAAWLWTHLAEVNTVLQFFVLILAVISGLFAIYWHIDKFHERRK
jgi:hypothetical protein